MAKSPFQVSNEHNANEIVEALTIQALGKLEFVLFRIDAARGG